MGETPQELTWELAAESALFRIFSRGVLEQPGEDPEPSDPILELRSNLDYLVHNYLASSSAAGGPDSQNFIVWVRSQIALNSPLRKLAYCWHRSSVITDTKISPASDALV